MKESNWHEAFEIERESLALTDAQMDGVAFERAADLLSVAPRIGVTGCGHSGICGMHFAHLLCCVERPARFISPAEAVHGAMGFVESGDVLVWISRGGSTDELVRILEICHAKDVRVIGVTEKTDSLLARMSDVVLPMSVTRECDPENTQGTTSFTVTAAIFHALQRSIIEKTGYKSERFALIHPAGAVGKRLNPKK